MEEKTSKLQLLEYAYQVLVSKNVIQQKTGCKSTEEIIQKIRDHIAERLTPEVQDILRRIKVYRDKVLAHNDSQIVVESLERFKWSEVNQLVDLVIHFLDVVEPSFFNASVISNGKFNIGEHVAEQMKNHFTRLMTRASISPNP